jgi:hypothetical protein
MIKRIGVPTWTWLDVIMTLMISTGSWATVIIVAVMGFKDSTTINKILHHKAPPFL